MKPLAIVVLELQFESCGCREKSISYDSCLSLKFVLPSPEAFCKNIQVLFHVPSKPHVRPHPKNTPKQYHILVTRG